MSRTRLARILREELDVTLHPQKMELYCDVLSRLSLRIELEGREATFRIKDDPELVCRLSGEPGSDPKVREQICFHIKARYLELARAARNAESVLAGLGEDEDDPAQIKGMAATETARILERLWFSWNLNLLIPDNL